MAPAPCVHWLRRSTPALVGSLLCEGRGGLNRLCAAFVLALSSSAGGVSAFLLYAQRFLDWEEGKIGLFVALFAVVTGTMILFNTIALPRLLARCCACPPPHDLSMVRAAFLGPPTYLLLLYLAPSDDAREAVAFCGIPLLGCGACALPHFRALFSAARPVAPRGQNAVLVAPQLTALAAWGGLSGILAALRTWEELPGRLGPNGRLQRGRAARPKSPVLRFPTKFRPSGKARPWRWSLRSSRFHRWCATGLAIGPRAAVSHATRDANPTPNPNPNLNPNPNQVASPLCALAFTHMLSAPQFIFVAAAGPVLLALLLLASLRRTTLRPYRDEVRAGPILVADPRRRLLLVGGESDMVPASPCAAAVQAVPGPTPSTAAAIGHQVGAMGEI